jgi:hypothetical protein
MRRNAFMNGDVIVCSVSQDEFIEDIGRMAPKGEPTHIPADLVVRSRDLNVLLSQSRLVRLNVNPLVRAAARGTVVEPPAPEVNELYSRALVENEQLRVEIGKVKAENASLRAELGHAQAHNAKLKEEAGNSGKLDAILKMLQGMPAGVPFAMSEDKTSVSVLDDIPLYIPSQIKSDSTEGRVSVAEETTDGSSLSGASKALKEKRKKQQ